MFLVLNFQHQTKPKIRQKRPQQLNRVDDKECEKAANQRDYKAKSCKKFRAHSQIHRQLIFTKSFANIYQKKISTKHQKSEAEIVRFKAEMLTKKQARKINWNQRQWWIFKRELNIRN